MANEASGCAIAHTTGRASRSSVAASARPTRALAQLQSDDPEAQIDLHLLAYSEEGEDTFYEDIEDAEEYARVHAVCSELMRF